MTSIADRMHRTTITANSVRTPPAWVHPGRVGRPGGETGLLAPFREVGGEPLPAHQLAALVPICEAVTVVIGRDFVNPERWP